MNKELFIQGFLDDISKKYSVDEDTAFEIFSIATITNKNFQEVYDTIWIKGKQDGGIDGAYFVDNRNSSVLMLFQCKNSKGLKQKEIEKFRQDINDHFPLGIEKPNSQDLKPKIDEYRQLSRDHVVVEIKGYFVYRGENYDASHAANQEFFEHYHKPYEFEIWDSNELYGKINQLVKAQNNRKDIRFTFHPESSNVMFSDRDRQGLYTYSVNNVRAANFRIRAGELCQLIQEELSANGTYDFLFAENIRGFLGFRPRPNKRMRDTLLDIDTSVYFPLFNNGITIICQKADFPTSPQNGKYLLPSYNPVIVNGLQTSRVIYEIYGKLKEEIDDPLSNVYVNVRLYETDDPRIIEMITDATNTQTPINYRDKVSNKAFGDFARLVFAHNDIAYISKRGETFSNEVNKFSDAVDSDTVLKYWYASFYEQPETAKNSISKVLEDIYDASNKDHVLERLFDGDRNSPVYAQLLVAYKIYRFVLNMRGTKEDEFIEHINELLVYGIYKKIEGNLKLELAREELAEAYEHAYEIIRANLFAKKDSYDKEGKIFSYNGYFKKSACKYDYNQKANLSENENLIDDLLKKLPS